MLNSKYPRRSCTRQRLPDDALEPVLVPLDSLLLVDLVGCANAGLAASALGNALTWAGPGITLSVSCRKFQESAQYLHAAVEVHAVNTDRRVVLDAEIDVLGDTETEVASLGEVALAQLVLLDLEATLENLLCLGAADGDVDSDLLVTADTECADGVAGLACEPCALVHAFPLLLPANSSIPSPFCVVLTYWRLVSDHSAAQAPWRLLSTYLQTRRRRC